jgi:hypothetical protein
MFREKSINSLKVVPVQAGLGKWDKTNCKGFDITPNAPYFTMFLCARKKSGKSSLINLITQKCIDKRTVVWVFCATHAIDPTWKEIKSSLEKKGNLVNFFDSLFDGKTNILDDIIVEINKGEEIEEPSTSLQPVPLQCKIKFEPDPSEIKKVYKPKKIACENLFILDDMPSAFLRNPAVSRLLKVHRHSKSSCIISSQYLNDLQPQSILQLDYFIAFKSLSQEKMESIHKLLDLSIDFESFWEIYKHCTLEPYSFMYLSIRDEKFRCRLNKEIELE